MNKIDHTESSDNVYHDLGFADAEWRQAKAVLAKRICDILDNKELKQIAAADILGITQPKVSALMKGRLSGFSIEKLIHYLRLLHQDVDIIIKDQHRHLKTLGHLSVVIA